jgi:O-antigen/teichoic acid export membrane protein
MTLVYFIALLGSRVLSFVAAILFARLMPASDFGDYVLANNNTLLWSMLSSYWLTTSAFRFMAMKSGREAATVLSTLLVGLTYSLIAAGVLAAVCIGASISPLRPSLIPTSLLMLVLIMATDVTGACFTASQSAGAYLSFNLRRAIVGFLASLVLILGGFGVVGAMLGQIVGCAAGLSQRSVVALWRPARWGDADRALLRRVFIYGSIGSLAFSFYMMIHVINRDFVALHLGSASTGRFALVFDTFYAPIGLICSAMSLGRMASMHAGAQASHASGLQQIGAYLERSLLFALPYAVGGWMLAPRLAALAFGKEIGDEVETYASLAAVHGAVMTLISAMLLGVLVLDRGRPLVLALVVTLGSNLGALLIQGPEAHAVDFARATLVAMSFSVVLLALWLVFVDGVRLRWWSMIVPTVGAALMAACLWFTHIEGVYDAVLAALLGAAVYAVWCQCTGALDFRPALATIIQRGSAFSRGLDP